jgi:hypothetical protein
LFLLLRRKEKKKMQKTSMGSLRAAPAYLSTAEGDPLCSGTDLALRRGGPKSLSLEEGMYQWPGLRGGI